MNIKLAEKLKIIELVALSTISTDTTTVSTGVAAGQSVHRGLAIVVITSVSGGADDTYTLTVQGSNTAIDSGFESAHESGEETTMAFTQPGGAQVATISLKPFKWYRTSMVSANGANFVWVCLAALEPSKLPVAAQDAS